jgi:hypothetical protein
MSTEELESLNLKRKPKPAQNQNNPKTTLLRGKGKNIAQKPLQDWWARRDSNPQLAIK